MAHVIQLDTYRYAKKLKEAKVPEAQIEVEVTRDAERTAAINKMINEDLATKYDVALIQKDIKELELKIEQIRRDMKFVGALIMLGMAALGLLIKL